MSRTRARDLRKSMTRQEVRLWVRLRELRPLGHHFRRQSALKPYIVDFECRRSRLIVEVDGHQHGFNNHSALDSIRDMELNKRGYNVLRFSNGEVDSNMDGVLETIRGAPIEAPAPHPAASRPPSPGGEG